jgi:hypothetical protein
MGPVFFKRDPVKAGIVDMPTGCPYNALDYAHLRQRSLWDFNLLMGASRIFSGHYREPLL